MRVLIALAIFLGVAMSDRLLKQTIKQRLAKLPARHHGHNVLYSGQRSGSTPPCAYISAIKWGTNTCTGSQIPVIIMPGECLVQFGSGGIATDIIYQPAAGGKQIIRFVYTGSKGVCGTPDRYAYQDVISPGQCLEGWTYTWNLTLPHCWIKWQEYDQSAACEDTKLATTTFMEPNECFYDRKFGLTWGLECSGKTATSTLYEQKAGVCSGTPYATFPNATCMTSFASGVQFKASYVCPGK